MKHYGQLGVKSNVCFGGNQKGKQMKPLHLKEHIFNLDAIVMVEPYDEGGVVHCTNNHAYHISEAEYKQLVELLRKDK